MSTRFASSRHSVLACILVGCGTAHAATLAGVGYGGTSQGWATCYLFNTGSTAVSITSKGFVREFDASSPTLAYDGCGTSIAAGFVCAFQAPIDSIAGYACKVTLGSGAANVRGELELRSTSNSTILNNVPLK
jgi:hypothetical protein